MTLFDGPDLLPEDELNEKPARWPVMAGAAVLFLLLLVVLWWGTRPSPAPPTAPPVRTAAAPPIETPEPPPVEPEAPPVSRPTPRRAAPEPAPAPAEPVALVRTLTVETDVEGALVFLDRVFLGNAPVTITEFRPGTHQLNVSAAGYDGVGQTIDLPESGPTTIAIKLAKVRLDTAVEVIHKHRFGSCLGELTANLSGFTYTAQEGDDGFALPLDAAETFEIDYLDHNLRLKQRGGRTWNFESPTGSADPLFVFHRDVERARARLAAQ